MTTALAVANAFIQLANEKHESITNMKLQKLVYFAQGFHVATKDGQSLFDDPIEAWQYGPVIPQLYHKFKLYFAGRIPESHPFQTIEALSDDEMNTVRWVYDNLGQYTAIQLSNFSHADDSPWFKVFHGDAGDGIIPVAEMKDYFKRLLVPKDQSITPAVA